jgi:hypothetical protein
MLRQEWSKAIMSQNVFKLRSKIFLYPGMAGWHFIAVPKQQSEIIKKRFGTLKRGWGSLPVAVLLGKASWKTSIFPDTKAGTYLLPLRAQIRKKEGLSAKDAVSFSIEILA